MSTEITTAIITSSVAILTSLVSLVVGLRTLRIQKSLSNSDKQIDYLQAKLKLLEEAKAELALVDYKKFDFELSNQTNLVKALAQYTEDVMANVPKILQKLKGHFDNAKLEEFESRINKVNRLKINQQTNKIFGHEYQNAEKDDSVVSDPVNFALNTKDDFKKFLADEMLKYNRKIENIIEISAH